MRGGDALKQTSSKPTVNDKKPGESKARRAVQPERGLILHPVQIRLRELGKTQKWLAQQMGVSEHTILNICAGRRRLSANSMTTIKLKTLLDVDYNFLILGPFGRN